MKRRRHRAREFATACTEGEASAKRPTRSRRGSAIRRMRPSVCVGLGVKHLARGTQVAYDAALTLGRTRKPDSAAVPDQEVREDPPPSARDELLEVVLDLDGILFACQSQTLRESRRTWVSRRRRPAARRARPRRRWQSCGRRRVGGEGLRAGAVPDPRTPRSPSPSPRRRRSMIGPIHAASRADAPPRFVRVATADRHRAWRDLPHPKTRRVSLLTRNGQREMMAKSRCWVSSGR